MLQKVYRSGWVVSFLSLLFSLSAFATDEDQALGQALLQASQSGQVKGVKKQIQQLAQTGKITINQKKFQLSKGLRTLFWDMLNQNRRFEILSLARDCKCFHGSTKGVVSAVDISMYSDILIRISDPLAAKNGIVSIISDLNQGSYDFGFPRAPVVGDNEQARKDRKTYAYLDLWTSDSIPTLRPEYPLSLLEAFIPSKYNERVPDVNFMKALQYIQNPDFRTEITNVINTAKERGVKFVLAYADALDHFHIKVNNDPNPVP